MANDTAYPGAVPPPPGVTPNLTFPVDSGGRDANLAVIVITDILVVSLFAARTYTKWMLSPKCRMEDLFCATAFIIIIMYTSSVALMYHYGIGYHAWDLDTASYMEFNRWLYASAVIYCPAAYFIKVTLLLLIERVLSVPRRVAWGIYGFVIAITLCYIPLQVFRVAFYLPIGSFRDIQTFSRVFFDRRKIMVAEIVLGLFTNAAILTLPILHVWPLKISMAKKLKICALLCAGTAAMAMGAYRTFRIINQSTTDDKSASFSILTLLTMLELTVGFACACLPPINIFLETRARNDRHVLPCHKAAKVAKGAANSSTKSTAARSKTSGQICQDLEDNVNRGRVRVVTEPHRNNNTAFGQGPEFHLDVEMALRTGKVLYTASDVSETTNSAAAAAAATASITSADGRAEGWLSQTTVVRPRPAHRTYTDKSIESCAPHPSSTSLRAEVTSSVIQRLARYHRRPESTHSRASSTSMGGIMRTVEISLEAGDGAKSGTAQTGTAKTGAPAANDGMAYAAYDGQAKLIPGRVWDGETKEYTSHATAYSDAPRDS